MLDPDNMSRLVPTVHLSAAKSEHLDGNILKKLQCFDLSKKPLPFNQQNIYMLLNLETFSILCHTERQGMIFILNF